MTAKTCMSYQGSDPDALSLLLSTPASLVTVEPRSKNIQYSCQFAGIGKLSIADCRYEGEIQFERKGESDKLLVFLPSVGDAYIGHTKSGSFSTPGWGTIADGKVQGRMEIAGRRQHLLLLLEQVELKRRLGNMLERTIYADIEFHPDLDLEGGPGKLLRMLSETTFAGLADEKGLQQSPLAVASLAEAISNLLLEALPHNFSLALAGPVSIATPKHVKRAIDYMQAHLAEPITLEEIAAAAQTSVRTLQCTFRRFRMTTPMAFLQELRMTAARNELLISAPGTSVSAVAQKWGLMHAGRFAVNYKKRFGELPSETIRG